MFLLILFSILLTISFSVIFVRQRRLAAQWWSSQAELAQSNQQRDKQGRQLEFTMHLLKERTQAIQNIRTEYEKRVFDLLTLFDIAKEINATLNQDNISQILLFTTMGQMGVKVSSLLVWEEHHYRLIQKGKSSKNDVGLLTWSPTDQVMRFVAQEARAITVGELEKHFPGHESLAKLETLQAQLLVPFVEKDAARLILVVGPKHNGNPFGKDQLEFLTVLTHIGGLALENAKLYTLAITDSLTKLYLQRYFILKLEEEIKRARRYYSPLALFMIDVDNFKSINDTHGHLEGNKVLIEIGQAIQRTIRETDTPARYGGEEFSLLLPMMEHEQALMVAERIRQEIAGLHFKAGDKPFHVTVSIGAAFYPEDAQDSLTLIHIADARMYEAKNLGKNQVIPKFKEPPSASQPHFPPNPLMH